MNLKHVQGSVTEHVGTFGFPLSSSRQGTNWPGWRSCAAKDIVAFHPFKQAGVITHENVTMTSSQTKTQKLLLDKDHISQQKINATSVSIILWIKDQILIGIYGQIDVDVLFRNVSKTSGDVGSAGGWHGSLENQADAYVACTVGKSQSWTVGPLNECYNWELPKSHTKNTEIVQHVT